MKCFIYRQDKTEGITGKLKKASMTVEAAVIVPMTVLVIALLIILSFYIHNRVWYTCAACEAAILGNMPAGDEGEAVRRAEGAASRWMREQAMPGSTPEYDVQMSGSGTEVSFSGQTYAMFRTELTPFSVDITVKKIRPEKYLRLVWAGKQIS